MPEEHEHGLAHGAHTPKKEGDKDRALYWGLGLGAAGLVVALLIFLQGGGKKQSSQPTIIHGSQPFIPNPTDISIGHIENIGAPLYWPGLHGSGTPHKPKGAHHHHHVKSTPTKTVPTSHKKYGKSPTGGSHGHGVTSHTHNPIADNEQGRGMHVNG